MPGQACTGRLGPRFSRTHERIRELQGLYHKGDIVYPDRDLPPGCWYNIFRLSEPPEIARAACVNRTCRTAAHDNQLWCPPFKKTWSPEYCGSLRTNRDGKDFYSLYASWQTGQPAGVSIIPGVHGPVGESSDSYMRAIQLSQAGALAAWPVGADALVGTDVATCQIRYRFVPSTGADDSLHGLTVLDSIGLVLAAGSHITGWDPRQNGNGTHPSPAFSKKYEEGTECQQVLTMIPAGLPECNGPSQLLTGGCDPTVCLWDLRNLDGGPIRRYIGHPHDDYMSSLARDPRHGTLLGGGVGGIICWDWETGAKLSTMWTGDEHAIESLALGRDRLISGGGYGTVHEWAIPDPQAIVEEPDPNWWFNLGDMEGYHDIAEDCWQGLGEGPDRILGGRSSGSICMLDCTKDPDEHPEELPIYWSVEDNTGHDVAVTCITAIDQVVVNGSRTGTMRIVRVDSHFGM